MPAKKKSLATKTKKKIDLLKPADREFVLNFLLLKNGTKAYMQAFPKVKYDSARVLATRLLAKVHIAEAIQECYDSTWSSKEKQISKLFDDLLNVVNADISDYIDDNGDIDIEKIKKLNAYPIAEYTQSISDTKEGQNIRRSIKLKDSLKAISELTKILGMIEEKVTVNINYDKEKAKEIQDLFNESVTG